ncbi:MAG: UDP-N-acetylmuramate dehydrogenase [Pseudomonadaceae bacterium]|nr:UDP-N-acetylmuramate dehydrogenase [Pseudomonadaceae bacterium]
MTGQTDAPVSNALATPCIARELIGLREIDDLPAVVRRCRDDSQRLIVLGEASNVLLPERLEATVARWQTRNIRFERVGREVLVTVDAGLGWHELVRRCVAQGLWGIENLALIPGSVGAAPIQNIGAYGVELSDCLERVEVFDSTSASWGELARDELEFGYRTSLFKRKPELIVSRLTLRLSTTPQPKLTYAGLSEELAAMAAGPSVRAIMEAVIRIRRRKLPDPKAVPNVGSFFHNPTLTATQWRSLSRAAPGLPGFEQASGDWKVPAAALIERCGYKDRADARARRLGVWHRQPLVLINPEGRRAQDVLEFAEQIRSDVEAQFGIRLQQEPSVVSAR